MICLDRQFDKIESSALYVLTDIMKEYALEIAKEIKTNAEVGGRSQPNLIDALNAGFDYGSTKQG
jgi:hypothetical protein